MVDKWQLGHFIYFLKVIYPSIQGIVNTNKMDTRGQTVEYILEELGSEIQMNLNFTNLNPLLPEIHGIGCQKE